MNNVSEAELQKRAEGLWTKVSPQNVPTGYDYTSAVRDGNTLTPDPEGMVKLPNQYLPKEQFNLMGFDLSTGVQYRNIASGNPDTVAAVMELRKSYVDQTGKPPFADVRPLTSLAFDLRSQGKSFGDFDRNVPMQWPPEQRKLAWIAAGDVANSQKIQPKLEKLQNEMGVTVAPAKFTQEQTLADPQFAKDARVIYKIMRGAEFEGGDIDAAKYLQDHLRWFDINVAHQAAVMGRVRAADYAGIEAYSSAIARWDHTEVDWSTLNILQNIGRGLVDPTNILGFGAAKVAISTAGRTALKQVLVNAAKVGAQYGAVAGGVGAGSETVAKGIASGDPAGAGKVAGHAAVGTVVGAGIGAGLGAGLTAAGRYGMELLQTAGRRLRNAQVATEAVDLTVAPAVFRSNRPPAAPAAAPAPVPAQAASVPEASTAQVPPVSEAPAAPEVKAKPKKASMELSDSVPTKKPKKPKKAKKAKKVEEAEETEADLQAQLAAEQSGQ
jgi:hypothetical protein